MKKQFDHAMDDIRYFVATVVEPEERGSTFWAGCVERESPRHGFAVPPPFDKGGVRKE